MQVVDKWRYATEESSEREIRILSKVHHMNCIQLHAVYVTSKRVYIVTELVTGGELLDAYVCFSSLCCSQFNFFIHSYFSVRATVSQYIALGINAAANQDV